jgi:hypothetical protein
MNARAQLCINSELLRLKEFNQAWFCGGLNDFTPSIHHFSDIV